MKVEKKLEQGRRWRAVGMTFLLLLSLPPLPTLAWHGVGVSEGAGLLPIGKSNVNQSIIDELFNPDPIEGSGVPNQNSNSYWNTRIQNNGVPPNTSTIKKSTVKDEFKCNLFESVPYEDILSALNSLNQAVNSPACSGDSKVGVQGIVDNNKVIEEAVKSLRGFVDNPATIREENATEISNKVDLAIRAAATIANSFAQTDALSKDCREAMSTGQVAMSINDLINGLTPYALTAAALTTAGAAAVPYIVGGSILTGALSSLNKIINENGIKVDQPDVRRAIVENTCQFIRLDQKYKFLIKSRDEQMSKITSDISSSQKLFSLNAGASAGNKSALGRMNALNRFQTEIDSTIPAARANLELDKKFIQNTSDNLKICQLGIRLAAMAQDKTSYVSVLLSSLDKSLYFYGSNNVAQAQALKNSGNIAMKALHSSSGNNVGKCADTAKSFIETIEQSASLAKELIDLAQDNMEKGLQSPKDYQAYKIRLMDFNQKQVQAQRVTDSLDKLQDYANTITQSEIDSEMARLRKGLLSNRYMGLASSPVLKWFEYVNGLHRAEISRFQEGFRSLQARAYRMTPSGETVRVSRGYFPKFTKDSKDAKSLLSFNLQNLTLGASDHEDICREMKDVWNRWISAIDYLAASDAFCNMLEPYVYDNRAEDKSLVAMCRGYSKNSPEAYQGQAILSTVAEMKNKLVVDKTRDQALLLQKKITDLSCVDNLANQTSSPATPSPETPTPPTP